MSISRLLHIGKYVGYDIDIQKNHLFLVKKYIFFMYNSKETSFQLSLSAL